MPSLQLTALLALFAKLACGQIVSLRWQKSAAFEQRSEGHPLIEDGPHLCLSCAQISIHHVLFVCSPSSASIPYATIMFVATSESASTAGL